MQRHLAFGLLLLAAVGCDDPSTIPGNRIADGGLDGGDGSTPVLRSTLWADRADAAYDGLIEAYWFEDLHRFYSSTYGNAILNYWWQAHAMDVVIDAHLRRGGDTPDPLIEEFYEGIVSGNGGLTNDYYDDMEWMALALLRAYGATGDKQYRVATQILWDDISKGWSDLNGGGISWNKTDLAYKNVPANAPAAILALRLYRLDEKPTDRALGEKLLQFVDEELVDPITGDVWDGIRPEGNIEKNLYTYNYGTYLGACLEYFEITGDRTYLDRALRTADRAMEEFASDDSAVLRSGGLGDGGLFAGILVRYLAELALAEELGSKDQARIVAFLEANASSLWTRGRTEKPPILLGHDWQVAPDPEDEMVLSAELSGVMLLEAMARLEREGLVKGP